MTASTVWIRFLLLPLACAWGSPVIASYVPARTVASPDGALVLTVERDDVSGVLAWSVTRNGNALVTRGALGLDITGFGTIADEGTITNVEERTVDTTWTPPYGERAVVPSHFREETLTLAHASHGALTVRLQVRAYDEGIALRYLIDGSGTFSVTGEKTSFPLPASTVAWVSSSAQGAISKVAIASVGSGVERPLTAELASDLFVSLGEANLRNHARMKFSRSGTSTLVPSLGGTSTYSGSFVTPWRYVRAAPSAPGLLQGNHFLLDLCDPSEVADTSWIRPGKLIREMTLTTQGGMACVDWAAAHGLDFVHIDAGWYGPESNASSDATTVHVDPARSPGPLDLQAVISYAASKNVGVVLYVNHLALEAQLDQILPLYQQWGVAGIKFGFVNVGSQTWTQWLHDSVKKCADHHLMVNVHDEYRMTGLSRTLPNFLTSEGVRGDEESPPNEMVVKTIFTRGLAGAADQTNCYFADRVWTMGSHASQMAKTVCLYSPWQYLFWYDSPAASPDVGGKGTVLQDVPELTFFQRLPTVWDETKWLDGHPDTHAVVARRKGDVWFLGALNGATARQLTIPLAFLTAGQNYRLELFRDDSTATSVTKVGIKTSVVNRDSSIQRTVAARNGLAAILTPTTDAVTPPEVDPPPSSDPVTEAGTINFETTQGYPAATSDIDATNGATTNAPFDGTLGWSRSTSSSPGRIASTVTSGEYTGGQALGTNGSGTFVGALRGVIIPATENTIRFDAQYNTGITVGFMHDNDADGRYDQGGSGANGDSGMGFGVGGATTVNFQRRNANFGSETPSGLGGAGGQWYRFAVAIGASVGGSRAVSVAVRNLTTATDLDFDSATAGTQAWTGTVTDANFGTAPEDSDGIFVRLTGSARVDNIRVTAVGTPFAIWMAGFSSLTGNDRLPAADPDHDGIPNLLEFVLDGNPALADREVLPTATVSGGQWMFTFRRRDDSEATTSLLFQIRSDLNAGDWTSVPVTGPGGSTGGIAWTVAEMDDEPDFVTITVSTDSAPKRFARLKVVEAQ